MTHSEHHSNKPPLLLAEALEEESKLSEQAEDFAFNAEQFVLSQLRSLQSSPSPEPVHSFLLQAWLRRASVLTKEFPHQRGSRTRTELRRTLVNNKPEPGCVDPKNDKITNWKDTLMKNEPKGHWLPHDEAWELWRVKKAIEALYTENVGSEDLTGRLLEAKLAKRRAGEQTAGVVLFAPGETVAEESVSSEEEMWTRDRLMRNWYRKDLVDIVNDSTIRASVLATWGLGRELEERKPSANAAVTLRTIETVGANGEKLQLPIEMYSPRTQKKLLDAKLKTEAAEVKLEENKNALEKKKAEKDLKAKLGDWRAKSREGEVAFAAKLKTFDKLLGELAGTTKELVLNTEKLVDVIGGAGGAPAASAERSPNTTIPQTVPEPADVVFPRVPVPGHQTYRSELSKEQFIRGEFFGQEVQHLAKLTADLHDLRAQFLGMDDEDHSDHSEAAGEGDFAEDNMISSGAANNDRQWPNALLRGPPTMISSGPSSSCSPEEENDNSAQDTTSTSGSPAPLLPSAKKSRKAPIQVLGAEEHHSSPHLLDTQDALSTRASSEDEGVVSVVAPGGPDHCRAPTPEQSVFRPRPRALPTLPVLLEAQRSLFVLVDAVGERKRRVVSAREALGRPLQRGSNVAKTELRGVLGEMDEVSEEWTNLSFRPAERLNEAKAVEKKQKFELLSHMQRVAQEFKSEMEKGMGKYVEKQEEWQKFAVGVMWEVQFLMK